MNENERGRDGERRLRAANAKSIFREDGPSMSPACAFDSRLTLVWLSSARWLGYLLVRVQENLNKKWLKEPRPNSRSVAFEVSLLGWFPRAKGAQSSWGSGGRCKPPQRGLGQRPRSFWKLRILFSQFWPFLHKSLNFQLGLNCGVFQGQGFVDHKTRCPSRCQSASSRPLLAILQYGVHLVNNVWLIRLSKRQKRHPFCHCIFVDPLFLMPCMRKCSWAENKRTKPRYSAQLYQKLI